MVVVMLAPLVPELGRDIRPVGAGVGNVEDSIPAGQLAAFGGVGDFPDVDIGQPHILVLARILHADVGREGIEQLFSGSTVQ